MTQSDINRAVVRRTGESTTLIRRMGFVLLIPHVRRRGKPSRRPACHREATTSRPAACLA